MQSEQPNKRVTLGPTRLRYFEGENVLTMQAEMASDGGGAYYNVYVPTARRWVTKMPEWCRHRRDETMAEIRRLTKDRRVKWIDED